jgi:hypothetical protein
MKKKIYIQSSAKINLEQILAFIIHHHLAKIKREIRAKRGKKNENKHKRNVTFNIII